MAGRFGGRTLKAPRGTQTRPTSDRVREAVFSSLENRYGCVEGSSVADLFAGSGALGIEALSRGASRVTFVDRDRDARACIAANCASIGITGSVDIVGADASRAVASPLVGEPFALLFVDPPYRIEPAEVRELLEVLANDSRLAPGAVVVYEHASGSHAEWPAGFRQSDVRTYGDTTVSYAVFAAEKESAE